jgi:hypothetical protein
VVRGQGGRQAGGRVSQHRLDALFGRPARPPTAACPQPQHRHQLGAVWAWPGRAAGGRRSPVGKPCTARSRRCSRRCARHTPSTLAARGSSNAAACLVVDSQGALSIFQELPVQGMLVPLHLPQRQDQLRYHLHGQYT